MKIQKQNNAGTLSVCLPKSICTGYGWEAGMVLDYRIDKIGTITIYKKNV